VSASVCVRLSASRPSTTFCLCALYVCTYIYVCMSFVHVFMCVALCAVVCRI